MSWLRTRLVCWWLMTHDSGLRSHGTPAFPPVGQLSWNFGFTEKRSRCLHHGTVWQNNFLPLFSLMQMMQLQSSLTSYKWDRHLHYLHEDLEPTKLAHGLLTLGCCMGQFCWLPRLRIWPMACGTRHSLGEASEKPKNCRRCRGGGLWANAIGSTHDNNRAK